MPPSLDPLFFPHIFETILLNSDRKTLLTARLVSRSMCSVVDPLLCGPFLELLTESDGSLGAWSHGRTGSIDSRRLPYFYRNGNESTRIAAMRQARGFGMHTSAASRYANSLLQHLPPQVRINIMHYDINYPLPPCAFATMPGDITLPACSYLQIIVQGCGNACCCQETAAFKHVSASVGICIEANYPRAHDMSHCEQSNCSVIAGIINPGVTELVLVGVEMGMLPCLFNGINVQANPDLQVRFRLYDRFSSSREERLAREAVKCFDVSESQVRFDYFNSCLSTPVQSPTP
ncbi:hypothetical protein A1Q2_00430 [Trichosporon asahii var. asahii CBS 8904]|uniref:F-box domain-containing protein n=2 Tax=Trichosporon asahii var. asahii TaxID=189963 RepID=K1VM47_TRIAC|nr:hypothetical protein A1Q1_04777 [Trichosporon asahii var. asahii CBS 2479]EJT46600.1 hypothetical protein A1Q1_04777 [Trichosporon asahii var. asahii CBS 2479]EKD05200.1 hypothetical protein A1Q2_00430 [Trichosporon asahii var. asahii CBS 8904]